MYTIGFADEASAQLVKRIVEAIEADGGPHFDSYTEEEPRFLGEGSGKSNRGFLLEVCTNQITRYQVQTVKAPEADRHVWDVAFVGLINGGTVQLTITGGASVDLAWNLGETQLATALNTLWGLTTPHLIEVKAWEGRWIIRFPTTVPPGYTTLLSFTVDGDNLVSGDGTGDVFAEEVHWDVTGPIVDARFASSMQGAVIMQGRMVVVHEWDDDVVFTLLDGCPEFKMFTGNLDITLPVTL